MNIIFRVLAPAVVLGLLLSSCGGGRDAAEPTAVKAAEQSTPIAAVRSAAAMAPPSPAEARIVPPSTPFFVNPVSAKSMVGTNLNQVVDHSSEYPFVNLMKQARPWFSGRLNQFADERPLTVFDSGVHKGDVKQLLDNQVARAVLFDVADQSLPGRVFDVFYDGGATLRYETNVQLVSTSAGRDRILLLDPPPESPQQRLTIVLTSMTANVPPNVRVLPVGGICVHDPLHRVLSDSECPQEEDFRSFELHHEAIIFNPDFLRRIQNYRGVRFMDWMRTNFVDGNIVQSEWANRPRPDDTFWSTGAGVPLEVMIALSNLMGMDPWFNIPHAASDDYIRNFARVVKNQLDVGRKATIEYSNETWNTIFGQAEYVTTKGAAAGLRRDNDGADNNLRAGQRFYSRRAREVMVIFEEVFGSTATSRLNRVMAGWFAVPNIDHVILNFEGAAAHVDQFAVAPYFGGVIDKVGERNRILNTGEQGVFDWILDDVNPMNNAGVPIFEEGGGSLRATNDLLDAHLAVLRRDDYAHIKLTAYEGGQHLLTGGDVRLVPEDVEAIDDILEAVNSDPRMAEAYKRFLTDFLAKTGQPFYHFNNVSQWSTFGFWGALRYQMQPQAAAPKYDALMKFIECNPLGEPKPPGCV